MQLYKISIPIQNRTTRGVTVRWKINISSMQIFDLQHHVEASTWITSYSVLYKLFSEHNSV